jgi:hypothetical protein
MSLNEATAIVYGTSPTNAADYYRASEIVRLAALAGYKFSVTGAITAP